MIRYVFREDEPIRIKGAANANPQVIGELLAKLADASGGELAPRNVVDAARAKNHPLHPHFEWNDSLAAEAYRLDQARNLIRIVRVEDDKAEDGTAPAFISINDGDGRAYRKVEEVKRSVDLQLALLKQARRDLDAWQRRYREIVDVCKIVDDARTKLDQRIAKSETRAAA